MTTTTVVKDTHTYMAAPSTRFVEPAPLNSLGTHIVLLHVPKRTLIGIDQYMYVVDSAFKGVKDIPPGLHVVSYASYDAHGGGYGPVTAMFLFVHGREIRDGGEKWEGGGERPLEEWMIWSKREGEVMVWEWEAQEERLKHVDDDETRQRIESSVRGFEFERNLGSYTVMQGGGSWGQREKCVQSWASWHEWRGLCGFVNEKVLERVAPLGGCVCVLAEDELVVTEKNSEGRLEKSAAEKALVEQLKHSMKLVSASGAPHAGKCYFTTLPGLVKRKGMSPEELTAINMDLSESLEEVLTHRFHSDEEVLLGMCVCALVYIHVYNIQRMHIDIISGEFQFAFLAFLLGHSTDGFLQWKRFILLMLGCQHAVLQTRQNLYMNFLQCLYNQIVFSSGNTQTGDGSQHLREGMHAAETYGDVLGQIFEDSFLRKACTTFVRWVCFEVCDEVHPDIFQITQGIGKALHDFLGWECGPVMEEFDDEDGPVVVDVEDMKRSYY